MRLAQGGDKAAFGALVSSHAGTIFQHLRRMLGRNTQDAEDLTQETFLRAFRSLKSFRHQSRFSTWLKKIATNIALNELRKKRLFMESLDAVDDRSLSLEVPDFEFSPEQSMDRKEAQMKVELALARLSDGLRVVFVLKELEGYTHEETARLLGLKPQAVRVRHHRAKKLLVKILTEETSGVLAGRGAPS